MKFSFQSYLRLPGLGEEHKGQSLETCANCLFQVCSLGGHKVNYAIYLYHTYPASGATWKETKLPTFFILIEATSHTLVFES
jgi:hypothetical protein